MGRAALSVAVVVALAVAGCQDRGGDETPLGSFLLPSPTSSSRPSQNLCERLVGLDVQQIVGGSVAIDPEASTASVCTYRVDDLSTAASYHVAIRLEDSFESIDQLASLFPDGVIANVSGQQAFWTSPLSTLWFMHQDQLYAIQLVGREGDDTAHDLAHAIAEAVVTELGGDNAPT